MRPKYIDHIPHPAIRLSTPTGPGPGLWTRLTLVSDQKSEKIYPMSKKNYTDEFRRDAVALYRDTDGATVVGIATRVESGAPRPLRVTLDPS